MADHGMSPCIKKIVLGIPYGSILFKKAKQFFISGNDLPHQQVLGGIILQYARFLDQTRLRLAFNDNSMPPIFFEDRLPGIGNQVS